LAISLLTWLLRHRSNLPTSAGSNNSSNSRRYTGVTQFAAFVNRTRRLRRDVARYAAGKGKLFEQPPHPVRVLRDVGIDFAVGAFQVSVRHQPGSAVARPGDIDHVQILFLDDAIQVGVDKIESWCRAPVNEQARFDVRQLERLLQEGIV